MSNARSKNNSVAHIIANILAAKQSLVEPDILHAVRTIKGERVFEEDNEPHHAKGDYSFILRGDWNHLPHNSYILPFEEKNNSVTVGNRKNAKEELIHALGGYLKEKGMKPKSIHVLPRNKDTIPGTKEKWDYDDGKSKKFEIELVYDGSSHLEHSSIKSTLNGLIHGIVYSSPYLARCDKLSECEVEEPSRADGKFYIAHFRFASNSNLGMHYEGIARAIRDCYRIEGYEPANIDPKINFSPRVKEITITFEKPPNLEPQAFKQQLESVQYSIKDAVQTMETARAAYRKSTNMHLG